MRLFSLSKKPISLLRISFGSLLALLCLSLLTVQPVHAASQAETPSQYDEFWQQDSYHDFSAWTFNGTRATLTGDLKLQPSSKLTCSSGDIDGGSASFDASKRLCAGTDPYAPGTYSPDYNYYNGGSFYFGTVTSPVHTTKQPFTTAVASWNAETPAGTWIETHIRVLEDNAWTGWYKLPIWASDFSAIKRHSIDGQNDTGGGIATDTFYTNDTPATAYQLSLTFFTTSPSVTPSVRRVAAFASYDSDPKNTPQISPDTSVWGKSLNVPQRSQMLPEYEGLGYGGGGEVWCSPTSTSMVMAYWSNVLHQPALTQTVPDTARDTYDFTYEGTGNWPFNTAYAGSHGLHAVVTRLYSMSQIEQWVKSGVPVVISIAYKKNELPGTPIPSSNGHLLVVKGFAANGDVITNDPAAATNETVQITYNRQAIQDVWLKYSSGTSYLIYPEHWLVPQKNRLSNW
ncbi:C39 family peptidase [Ktedonospora formicarum]|uniref:Peptidase C39-like domain-containing protein n=1 Tax=Ktedonospora formicarum TaxID=2778364 RepID=A0A8J3I204_9CHLR|nr:C39 family peptidase [Ktedonospora formicarum]GHO43449.1 hypothetical protein KSX_16120 [Ktedonospora formicarum]